MAARLDSLIADPAMRKEMGVRAGIRALAFDSKTMARSYEVLYDKLMKGESAVRVS
jgi:hypothetical protein